MAEPALARDFVDAFGLDAVLELTESLTEILRAENHLLAQGQTLPEGATARKAALAMRIETAARALGSTLPPEQGLHARLEAASRMLGRLMQENVVRTQAAMQARAQRVDAAMSAVRQGAGRANTYDATGQVENLPSRHAQGRLA